METLRVGLIGYGGMGRHHAAQIDRLPGMTLVSVADPDPAATKRARAERAVETHPSGEKLIEQAGVDAVVIAAPTCLHLPIILAGARAGKHVFCEKPLCLPTEDSTPVMTAVQDTGIVFGFGLVLRYMAAYRSAKDRMAEGRLGKVMLADARYGGMLEGYAYVFSPEVGGGLINEHTIHMIDALDDLMGPIVSVAARLHRVEGRSTEDNAGLLFTMKSGAVATLAASGTSHMEARLAITGTGGEIVVTGNSRLEEKTEGGWATVDLPETGDPYGRELEEWKRAVLEGRQPRTGIPEALRISRIVKSVHRSGEVGETVPVE